MNKYGLVCLLLVGTAAVASASALSEWHEFKLEHSKSYDDPREEVMRQSIFLRSKQLVESFNKHESKEAGYELGLNHLADWTSEEFRNMLGVKLEAGRKLNRTNSAEAEAFLAKILGDRSAPLPETVDWRKVPGRVTPVKDQRICNSSWAFSTKGVLEGQQLNVTKRGDLVELSEQNLLDCVDAGNGCSEGGLPIDAMQKIKEEGGIVDSVSYPYRAKKGNSCKFDKSKAVMSDSGYVLLKSGDEELLKEVVAKFGPVSVAIDASPIGFHYYTKGVFRSITCKKDEQSLNQALLIVGYGKENGADYWLVKNSWGTSWGAGGYAKIARNRKNVCGIATMAAMPTFDGQ